MPRRPPAVAVLTVTGLLLIALGAGLVAAVLGGLLIGAGVGACTSGVAALVIGWLVEQT